MTNLKMGDPDNQPVQPTGCTWNGGGPLTPLFFGFLSPKEYL